MLPGYGVASDSEFEPFTSRRIETCRTAAAPSDIGRSRCHGLGVPRIATGRRFRFHRRRSDPGLFLPPAALVTVFRALRYATSPAAPGSGYDGFTTAGRPGMLRYMFFTFADRARLRKRPAALLIVPPRSPAQRVDGGPEFGRGLGGDGFQAGVVGDLHHYLRVHGFDDDIFGIACPADDDIAG